MDWAYNVRVDAATEMVAVFYEEGTDIWWRSRQPYRVFG